MSKKLLLILECILILALLSGCWSRKEPKNMSMVNSMLYDITDSGEIRLVAEIMHPAAQAGSQDPGSQQPSALTFVCEGKTIAEALRNVNKSIDKELFGGMNEARLFSEKLCLKGLNPLLDFFTRDHLIDETPLMVVVQGDEPDQIYTCITGLSNMVGNYLSNLSDMQQKVTCEGVFVTCLQFLKDSSQEGKQPVMGLVKIIDSSTKPMAMSQTGSDNTQNTQKLYMSYEGLAAFKDDKLVGYMNGIETRDYNIITNNLHTTSISLPHGNDFVVAIIKKTKSKATVNYQDEQAKIEVNIKAVLSLIQECGTVDISKREGIEKVEQLFNAYLESEVTKTIEKAQHEFKSDIFGFGSFLHAQQPKEWKKIKDKWDDAFSKAQISVTVESSVIMEGEVKIPFTMEKKRQ